MDCFNAVLPAAKNGFIDFNVPRQIFKQSSFDGKRLPSIFSSNYFAPPVLPTGDKDGPEFMDSSLHARFAELQSNFADGLNEKLADIQTLLDQVVRFAGAKECLSHVQALEALVHKLSGISGTFSFHGTHEAARNLELACDRLRSAAQVVDQAQTQHIRELFDAVLAAVEMDRQLLENAASTIQSENLSTSTVPDSFHNTNSINGFRGMFGLNKAII
jgi:HPt (histidine-containing phosphotransfer) domain-containing protein